MKQIYDLLLADRARPMPSAKRTFLFAAVSLSVLIGALAFRSETANFFSNINTNSAPTARAALLFDPGNASCINPTEVGGVIFLDVDLDGVCDATEERLSGVSVSIFDDAGQVGVAQNTNSNGEYLFTSLTAAQVYRVEITLPDIYKEGYSGTDSKSTTQFVTAGSCDGNLGLIFPECYCQDDPPVLLPCYVEGAFNGVNSASPAMVTFPESADGHDFTGTTPTAGYEASTIITHGEVGAVYGVAWQRTTQSMYLGAFHKRYVGYGPGGPDAIYQVGLNGTLIGTIELDALLAGTDVAGADVHDFTVAGDGEVYDLGVGDISFDGVGKRSLGDLEISGDMETLYVVNLFNKTIYAIDVSDGIPANANIADSWAAPDATGAGRHRPYGLAWHKGKLWVGSVDENGTNAYVHSLDPSGTTFDLELTIPLSYARQAYIGNADGALSSEWNAWATNTTLTYMTNAAVNAEEIAYPQALLSDIEFAADGDMIIGFRDRFGDQSGSRKRFRLNENFFTWSISAGDILKTCFDPVTDTYTLEGDGGCSTASSEGLADSGPGGREFYFWDLYDFEPIVNPAIVSGGFHWETTQGGLLQLKGNDYIMTTALDPFNDYTGGVLKLQNANGRRVGIPANAGSVTAASLIGGYTIFETGDYDAVNGTPPGDDETFAKANGLGDLEAACESAPLEIGNYVWEDTNNNGVQDPEETGIDGLTITLWKDINGVFTQIATTTTVNGIYGFSNVTSGAVAGYEYNVAQLLPDMDYELRFPTTSGLLLISTMPNNGGGDANGELRDSDANSSGVIEFTTSEAGTNDHSFDVAYSAETCPVLVQLSASPDNTICAGASIDLTIMHSINPGNLAIYSAANSSLTAVDLYNLAGHGGLGISPVNTIISPTVGTTSTIGSSPSPGSTITYYAILALGNPEIDDPDCLPIVSVTVTVNPLPIVAFTAPADLCLNANVQAGLGSGTPTGGVYSGPGVTDDGNGMTYSFDPAAAGTGIHTVTYTFIDINSCSVVASDDIEVFALPVVTFSAPADLCIDAGIQAGLGGGTATGGVYSGPGVTDDGNGMTYSFDPATAGAAVHTITYTITDGNGCRNSASDDIEVFALPVITFSALADLCINAGVQAGLGGATPTGGVYSGPGVTDDGNGMTYSFDPAAAGVDAHTITYDYTDGNGCSASASDDVEVFALPIVTFTAPADCCIDLGVQTGLGSGSPTGGVYSGPGVTDDANGMTYSFDPAAAGVGVHMLTYTFTDANGCTASASDNKEVFALPIVTFTVSPTDLFCLDETSVNLSGGSPAGGVYSGTGVTDDGNGTTFTFDITTAAVGVHTVTYTFTDANGCTNTATDDLTINPLTPVPAAENTTICSEDSPYDPGTNNVLNLDDLLTGPGGGSWSSTDPDASAALSGSTFTANTSMEGITYPFTYIITGGGPGTDGCGDQEVTINVTVNDCYASLGDFIWYDSNDDGIQDIDEPGVAGIIITLYPAPGGVKATDPLMDESSMPATFETQPGMNGAYLFSLLPPGQYAIEVVAPEDLQFTFPDEDTGLDDNTDDSDINPADGCSESVVLVAGQEYEDLDGGVISFDYGDLPAGIYATLFGDNGPIHAIPVIPEVYLGEFVDDDVDGQDDPTMPNMALGDDNDDVDDDDVDDEDGITFLTPLVPSFESCIEVIASSSDAAPAYLNGFIDFSGTGILVPLVFSSVDGADLAIPTSNFEIPAASNEVTYELCFEVPDDALFSPGGLVYSRFRISTVGGLSASGAVADGEVEDYKIETAKIGNLVWRDLNYNGEQDEGEPGIGDIDVILTYSGPDGIFGNEDDFQSMQTTDENGNYYFCGLIEDDESMYKLIFDTEQFPTLADNLSGPPEDDINDSDGIDQGADGLGVMFNLVFADIPEEEDGLTDMDANNPTNPNDVENYPDAVVDQSFDQGFSGYDYGDLPPPYDGVTLDIPTGAKTIVLPGKYLGSCVDVEQDGQPGDGDDTNAGLATFGTCEEPGDDEDGIEFITPMVPGYSACIEVTYVNDTDEDEDAYLNAWSDFNGDDVLEKINFTTVDNAPLDSENLPLPPSESSTLTVCFDVPDDAVFPDGNVFFHFRMGCEEDLPVDGTTIGGEIEDYTIPLAKIGNYVWEDINFDGLQDGDELGINEVAIDLIWAGPNGSLGDDTDNVTYETTTANINGTDGLYYFCGLIGGDYKLVVTTPTDYTPSKPNVPGDEELDNDGVIMLDPMDLSMVMTTLTIPADVTILPTGEESIGDEGDNGVDDFPDGQVDETYDFAFGKLDYGDLPEEEQGEGYETSMANNGAVHVIIDDLYLGSCVDAEQDGAPDADAGFYGEGDDATGSAAGAGEDCNEDEDGVEFLTPLVPGYVACIEVTYTATAGAVLQAWSDWDGDGTLGVDEEIAFLNGVEVLAPNPGTSKFMCFRVPEGATYNEGQAFMRFRLSPAGGLEQNGPDKFDEGQTVPQGEVEDYMLPLAKLGNLVWQDDNFNGIQDEGEEGIAGVPVDVIWQGIDMDLVEMDDNPTYEATTNEDGEYYVCGLIAGDYKIVVETPTDLTPSQPNQGSGDDADYLDSDGEVMIDDLSMVMVMTNIPEDVTTLPTGENGIGDKGVLGVSGFPDAQVDESNDFAFGKLDYGDLPDDPENAGDYATLMASNGPIHYLDENAFLGNCVDAEQDGAPDEYAGTIVPKDVDQVIGGDDNTGSDCSYPTETTCSDDENSIAFLTPLIGGSEACIEVAYTVDTDETYYLKVWTDFENDGILDEIDFTDEGTAVTLPGGVDQTIELCFEVPELANLYEGGLAFFRLRLTNIEETGPAGPAKYTQEVVPGGEVEDVYLPLAKVGNLVWYDDDLDGAQGGLATTPQELGVEGVEFILTYAGYEDTGFGDENDIEYTVLTNPDGTYNFCGLIEGKYMMEVQKYDDDEADPDAETPERYILTIPNLAGGDDELDSDFAPSTMIMIPDLLANDLVMSEDGYLDNPGQINGFPDNQDDLTIDAGWIPEPNLESLLNIAGVDFGPDPKECDEFNIIVDVCIKNTGYVEKEGVLVGAPLANMSALLDLQAELGDAYVGLDGAPELLSELGYDNTTLMDMPVPDRIPGINPNYNGSDDTELLDGTGIVYPGENICVRLNITMNPTLVSMAEAMAIDLQAKVSGLAVNYQGVAIPDFFNGGAQYMAMDLSDNDWNFDGTYEDSDDAEAFGNCFKEVQPLVVHNQVNISANSACGVCIDPSEVVLGYQDECGEDNYPLGGFYRISVDGVAQDALEVCLDGSDIVDGKFTYSIRTVNKPCNSTWGEVLLEDKTLPTLECPDEIDEVDGEPLLCADIATLMIEGKQSYEVDKDGNVIAISDELKAILDLTGYAIAQDNCAGLTIHVEDELLESESCEDQTIVRSFWIEALVQEVLEKEHCEQEIHFTKPTLYDVRTPRDAELSCTDELQLDDNGNPHPEETGYPVVVTGMGTYELSPEFCNLAAGYTDGERITVCEGTYKVVRHWQVVDWCAPYEERLFEFDQIIKVADEDGPTVVCTEVDYDNDGNSDLRTYSTGPYDCTASFEVPLPEVTDECSSWSVLTEILSEGIVVATIPADKSRLVSGIPVGCHEIKYTVTDDCGNKTIAYCPFQVLDQVAPIAVCDDDLNISLGGQSFARITAADIDEGSSDNCGPIRIEVRRRILDIENYGCLEMFDYDQDGEVIDDEVNESVQFGDPEGDGHGEKFYYTPWEEYVDFNCCDMGGNVRIELRVWDDANGNGIVGDHQELLPLCDDDVTKLIKDNYNVCWMDVFLEDKVPPVCTPPLAARVDCDELPYDFDPQDEVQMTALFGAAEGFDNCGAYTVEELEADTENLNDCGSGSFIRKFQVTDAKGSQSSVCEQLVTIDQIHDYWIKFPADASANCGAPKIDTVMTHESACDLLAISVKDETFSASGDECYKIFRTYSVINWCEYDGESDPVVVSREEDCDGIPGDEAVYVIVKTRKETDPCYDYYGATYQADHYEHVWYDRDSDPFNLLPEAGTKGESCDYTTNPTGFWKEVDPITENEDGDEDGYPANGKQNCEIASVGYWQYTQVIKVYDNVDPKILFDAPEAFCSYSSDEYNGCPAEVSINFQVDENCTPEDVIITVLLDANRDGVIDEDITDLLTSTYPDFNVEGSFPLGLHDLVLRVSDGCGNEVEARIPFEVKDCKAPSPICINGLALELMPVIPAADVDGDGDIDNGAVTIWASDFIASPVTDCTGEVKYSMNRSGEPNSEDLTGLTLTCDDDASTLVQIWAYDGAGNADYCETYVLVQDNMVQCTGSGSGSISGLITTEETEAVEGVMVELSGGQFESMATKANGVYAFENLETGFDYTVTPHHDVLPLNGVSTFDLVLMSKHILGLDPLDSPYKLIAADINNDKQITARDVISVRRLLLNIDVEFVNNTSWRFIPRAYVFPDPANPWAEEFPEVININDLQGDLSEEDFVAAKIGDVSGDAKPNLLAVQPRTTNGLFLLDVQEQELKAGNVYQIDFKADQLAEIQGYQFTLSIDQASTEIVDIAYGVATANNFGLNSIKDGLIATSWNKVEDEFPPMGETQRGLLFTLHIKAIADSKLSDILGVSSRVTVAEAYDENDGLMDVGIDFNSGLITKVPFELYQNIPNPFREETMVGFYLPQASETTLRIHDASGKVIKLIRGEFGQGQNRVILKRSELAETGILYYTLTAGEHTATRKMILIK